MQGGAEDEHQENCEPTRPRRRGLDAVRCNDGHWDGRAAAANSAHHSHDCRPDLLYGRVSALLQEVPLYHATPNSAHIVSFMIAMDFFVAALVINRSMEMFASALGTWIPFATSTPRGLRRDLAPPPGASDLPAAGSTEHKQGRVAGENAAGGRHAFVGTLGTQVVKVFDLAVARIYSTPPGSTASTRTAVKCRMGNSLGGVAFISPPSRERVFPLLLINML